jgi:hypothetical protein
MEPIESSETSASNKQTPGTYPKESKLRARICLKRGRVQSIMHIGSTFENDIKELDPRKAYKYLVIEKRVLTYSIRMRKKS